MSLIVTFTRTEEAATTFANYAVAVNVTTSPTTLRQIASGYVSQHRRDDGWPALLAKFLRQNYPRGVPMSTSSGHTPAEWAAKARREQAAPDLLASCQELREALACAMRVIYAYSRESDVVPAALAFVAELEQMGIKDGIGVRADAAITAAGGKS